jgi:hypothetical protein
MDGASRRYVGAMDCDQPCLDALNKIWNRLVYTEGTRPEFDRRFSL